MLLAVAADDRERFAQRLGLDARAPAACATGCSRGAGPDGRVVDDGPATDADLDAARALLLAARPLRRAALRRRGASARRARSPSTRRRGRQTGPCSSPGRGRAARAVVNPSYWSPRAFARSSASTTSAASSRRLTERLLESGLPPDWARVEPPGVVHRSGPPSGGEPVYSLRRGAPAGPPRRVCATARTASSRRGCGRGCATRPRRGAAGARRVAGARTTSTPPRSWAPPPRRAPRATDRRRATLLAAPPSSTREHPSYYGAAWVALGREMLETGTLGRC